MTNDGTVILKFWLHISKEEQLRRFIELTSNSQTAWQVTAEDWDHHHKYEEYVAAVRDMVVNTNTEWAPWTVVPANDCDAWLYVVFRNLIERLEDALKLERADWPDLLTLSKLTDGEAGEKEKAKDKKKEKSKEKDPDKSLDKTPDKTRAKRRTRRRKKKRKSSSSRWTWSLPSCTTSTSTQMASPTAPSRRRRASRRAAHPAPTAA